MWNLTTTFAFLLGVCLLGYLYFGGLTDADAMGTCMAKHSAEVCYNSLGR